MILTSTCLIISFSVLSTVDAVVHCTWMKSLCNDAATHLHHNSEGKAGCVLLCAMHLAGWVPLTNTDLISFSYGRLSLQGDSFTPWVLQYCL